MEASETTDVGKNSRTPKLLPNREHMSSEFLDTACVSTDWTDEKHSLYLKSMEASFVDQLYGSMGLLDQGAENQNPLDQRSRHRHGSPYSPSGQFKVLRDGGWKKINFRRPEVRTNRTDDSGNFMTSPWFQHFRPVPRMLGLPSDDIHRTTPSSSQAISSNRKNEIPCASRTNLKHSHSGHTHSCHKVVVGSNTEVSDQNFVDEEIEGEKPGNICHAKRTRILNAEALGNDQVVPCRKPSMTGETAEKRASSSRRMDISS